MRTRTGARARLVLIGAAAVALMLVARLFGVGGCAREPRQAIVVLLDAARADRFSSYGYARDTTPRMDALARSGVLFESCFSQRTHTRASLPTLFYSRYFALPMFPFSSDIPIESPEQLFQRRDDEAVSLPRALALDGIHTAAITAHAWLRKGTEFAAEFDELHDLSAALPPDERYGHPRAESVVGFAMGWLDAHRNEDFFLYVHLMDTHFPHFLEDDSAAFFGAPHYAATAFTPQGRPKDWNAPLSSDDRRYLDALYDGDLRYTDRQLGQLFDHLAADGRLDRMVVAITADHGEFLLDKPGHFEHGYWWYDIVSHVPLILHAPGRLAPARTKTLCELVDLEPTLLGLLDVDLPRGKRVDGVDLVEVMDGDIPERRYAIGAGGGDDRNGAVRDARYKAIFFETETDDLLVPDAAPSVPRALLFDVQVDPVETQSLWDRALHGRMLRAYRDRARASYLRYAGSRTSATPRDTFAVSTLDIRKRPAVDARATSPFAWTPAKIDAPHGWLDFQSRAYFGLLGRPDGERLALDLAVPNGRYELSLGVAGDCIVESDGAPSRPIRVPGYRQSDPTQITRVPMGVVEIADERLSLAIVPDPTGSGCWLRTFVFTPESAVPADAAAAEDEAALAERLRVLGYLDD
jgi:arylsulfatase